MLPGAARSFRVAEHWHWPVDAEAEDATLSVRSAFMLQETRHIVDLTPSGAAVQAPRRTRPGDPRLADRHQRAW